MRDDNGCPPPTEVESTTREVDATSPIEVKWIETPDRGTQLSISGVPLGGKRVVAVVADQIVRAASQGVDVGLLDMNSAITRWFRCAACPPWCDGDHGDPDPSGFHHDGESEGLKPRWQIQGDDWLYVLPTRYVGALEILHRQALQPAMVEIQDTSRTVARLRPDEARHFASMLERCANVVEGDKPGSDELVDGLPDDDMQLIRALLRGMVAGTVTRHQLPAPGDISALRVLLTERGLLEAAA